MGKVLVIGCVNRHPAATEGKNPQRSPEAKFEEPSTGC